MNSFAIAQRAFDNATPNDPTVAFQCPNCKTLHPDSTCADCNQTIPRNADRFVWNDKRKVWVLVFQP